MTLIGNGQQIDTMQVVIRLSKRRYVVKTVNFSEEPELDGIPRERLVSVYIAGWLGMITTIDGMRHTT